MPQSLREKLKQGARDSRDGGGGIRASLGGAVGITPTATTKVMSNYMGIGIDAKVTVLRLGQGGLPVCAADS